MRNDPRFQGIEPFEKKVWLSSPTMHGDEQHWVDDAIRTKLGGDVDVSAVPGGQPVYYYFLSVE